jgi:hypothetical protein
MAQLRWKKQRLLSVITNRNQAFRDAGPSSTPEQEIETESTGLYFITEASSNASPNYIITE